MSLSGRLAAFFFGAVIVRLTFHFISGFTADDAYITFRYAENLANQGEFVYNLGERVLGTTTPLFTLVLAFLAVMRVDPVSGSLAISLACSGWIATMLYSFSRSLRFGYWSFVAPLAYILWPRSLPAEISGMETALFSALIVAAFWQLHNRSLFYALAAATLASLVRPEGFFCVVIVFLVAVRQDARRFLAFLAVPAVLVIPWLLFSQFYFGSVIPHSAIAKLALYGPLEGNGPWDNLITLMGWRNPLGWIHTLLALVGLWWLNKKQNFGYAIAAWLTVFIAFLTFTGTPVFFWYFSPANPLYILLAAAVLPIVQGQWSWFRNQNRSFIPAVTIVMCLVLLILSYTKARQFAWQEDYNSEVLQPIGEYLYTHADRENDILAAEDIGHIGYYSQMRLLDRDGLISPVATNYNARQQYQRLIIELKPDWLGAAYGSPISGFVDSAAFLSLYQHERTWEAGTEAEYRLYRLRKQPEGEAE